MSHLFLFLEGFQFFADQHLLFRVVAVVRKDILSDILVLVYEPFNRHLRLLLLFFHALYCLQLPIYLLLFLFHFFKLRLCSLRFCFLILFALFLLFVWFIFPFIFADLFAIRFIGILSFVLFLICFWVDWLWRFALFGLLLGLGGQCQLLPSLFFLMLAMVDF